jgi:hypothetical protein
MRIMVKRIQMKAPDGNETVQDVGKILLFLHDPTIEPTNNRGAPTLRGRAIARKLSHGSKNKRGAAAFAAFSSVIYTAARKPDRSIIDTLQNLFQGKSDATTVNAHPPPGSNRRKPLINYSQGHYSSCRSRGDSRRACLAHGKPPSQVGGHSVYGGGLVGTK